MAGLLWVRARWRALVRMNGRVSGRRSHIVLRLARHGIVDETMSVAMVPERCDAIDDDNAKDHQQQVRTGFGQRAKLVRLRCRTRWGWGKSVTVRVGIGGRRMM